MHFPARLGAAFAALALIAAGCKDGAAKPNGATTPTDGLRASRKEAPHVAGESAPGSGTQHKHTNRLVDETSPYLLQHAHNPVDWYPWGAEAFAKAKAENKPIFLSIGYSTCHWCHVMERESFENEATAKLMNELFVCIKLDREERPDIDQIYMRFTQAFIQSSGGWPMSVWMTPDRRPFFAGTYFPPDDSQGRWSFTRVCRKAHELWNDKGYLANATGERLTSFYAEREPDAQAAVTAEALEGTANWFRQNFDATWGGFGGRPQPKFPSPHQLNFLFRRYYRTGDPKLLAMAEKTLDAMALGGIHDHVGGGFHRYSTDRKWLVPHFEKMLYDQAGLLWVYIEGFQSSGNRRHADVARDIVRYAMRDMRDSGGAFYSAEDADSEGEEGKFYVWSTDELTQVLGADDAKLFIQVYNARVEGNWADEASGHALATNIPHLRTHIAALATELKVDDLADRLAGMRDKLLAVRSKRIRPLRDDKILTSWNGLFISALARGARALEEPSWAAVAGEAADFLLATHRDADGRLLRSSRNGKVKHTLGYVDDYAFLACGLLDLYEATGDARWLAESAQLARAMVKLFGREGGGLLYFTGSDGEALITRSVETYDGAIPAGNSVAAYVCARLGRLLTDRDLGQQAESMLQQLADPLAHQGPGYTFMMLTLDFLRHPSRELVLAGTPGSADFEALRRVVDLRFMPDAVLALHPSGDAGKATRALMEFVAAQTEVDGKAAAYVCENYACKAPVTTPRELADLLAEKPGK